MSTKFTTKLSAYAACLTGREHQTAVEEVRKDGELIGVMLRQSRDGGDLDNEDFGDDLVYIPLELLGDVGAAIYEILENR